MQVARKHERAADAAMDGVFALDHQQNRSLLHRCANYASMARVTMRRTIPAIGRCTYAAAAVAAGAGTGS